MMPNVTRCESHAGGHAGAVTGVLASTVLAMQAFVRLSGASGKGANLELAQRQSSLTGLHTTLNCCPPPYAAMSLCSGLAVRENGGIHMSLGGLH